MDDIAPLGFCPRPERAAVPLHVTQYDLDDQTGICDQLVILLLTASRHMAGIASFFNRILGGPLNRVIHAQHLCQNQNTPRLQHAHNLLHDPLWLARMV